MKINYIKYPTEAEYAKICERPQMDVSQLNSIVAGVLADIKANGDKAVKAYEEKFDKVQLESLAVTEAEIAEAEKLISPELKDALILAHKNIAAFHEAQQFAGTKVETVMKSEALLIGNKELTPEKQATLDEFLFRIQSVLVADDKKYVLMNAPTEKVKEICSILPGIKSPTVLPLATEGWTSVHAVIDQKHFWEIVGQLKEKGAEGILVLPIEKMIL